MGNRYLDLKGSKGGKESIRLMAAEVSRKPGQRGCLLPRHGRGHATPPHKINFRANSGLGIGRHSIFATNAVGSAHPHWWPGELVIFQDFLDFT